LATANESCQEQKMPRKMGKVDFSNKAPSKFIVTKQGFLKLFLQKDLLKKLETINSEFERYSNENLSLL
jgi:hypothetical protein